MDICVRQRQMYPNGISPAGCPSGIDRDAIRFQRLDAILDLLAVTHALGLGLGLGLGPLPKGKHWFPFFHRS